VDDVVEFIDRYRMFTQRHEHARMENFQADFDRLRAGMSDLLEKVAQEHRRTASTFNIFHLLRVADSEVYTHSALLADLLNPRGSHAQGTLFLEHFFSVCADGFPGLPVPHVPLHPNEWTVQTEKVTPLGNLDMVLSSSRLGFLYAIENKIWAQEQPEQLARYSRWLQQQKAEFPHQALVYLTPDGRESWTHSGETYFRLSYSEHIALWLGKALIQVEPPRLRETLAQYIDVLKAY
jgi:hypothetical protein